MPEEILNIEYHVKKLFLKALNKYKTTQEVADAVGYSARQVLRLKKDFNVQWNTKTMEFEYAENKLSQRNKIFSV